MLKIFHNTIKLVGKKLDEARKSARNQNERIYLIFLQNKGKNMTPFQVHSEYNKLYPNVPVTSIRRSMTYLTENSMIQKLDSMDKGIYGKNNHQWTLKLVD
jgi:Fe2+ or Zn2+ uptake regulation protein